MQKPHDDSKACAAAFVLSALKRSAASIGVERAEQSVPLNRPLVEMLHCPPRVSIPIEPDDAIDLVRRDPSRAYFAEPAIEQPHQPFPIPPAAPAPDRSRVTDKFGLEPVAIRRMPVKIKGEHPPTTRRRLA